MSIAASECFSFPVDFTEADYTHMFSLLNRRQQSQITARTVYFVAILGAVPVALVLGFMSTVMTPENNAWEVRGLCVFAYVLGMQGILEALRFIHARAMRRLSSDAAREWKSALISLDAVGIRTCGDLAINECRWPGVTAVTVEDGSLMFWIGSQYGMRIPERAFATAAERNTVLDYARRHIAPAYSG